MNDFNYRLIQEEDYEQVLCKWWHDWHFPSPPKHCLPRNGFIVSDREGDLYGGYIYFTDSKIAWVEWIISNKSALPSRRRGALEFLLDVFTEMAKGAGVKHLYTSTLRPEFVNSLSKCGFQSTDINITQLIKNI